MKKFKIKNLSFGPVEASVAMVALLVSGFIGYQFADIRDESAQTVANAENTDQTKQESEIEVKEEKSAESKPVEVPEEKELAEVSDVSSEEESKPEDQDYDKPEDYPSYQLVPVSVQAVVQGADVMATATIAQNVTGECTFMFKSSKTGEMIKETSGVEASNKCSISLDIDKFSPGEWKYTTYFKGENREIKGQAEQKTLTIN